MVFGWIWWSWLDVGNLNPILDGLCFVFSVFFAFAGCIVYKLKCV
jgi:hypothetical protein